MKKLFQHRSLGWSLMLTCFLSCLNAQEEIKKTKHYGGFGHFAGSYETVNLTELNAALKTMGYDELPGAYPSFGGAGYFVLGNILIGGGGASLSGVHNQGDSTVLDMSAGYGYASFGYIVSTGKRSFLFPSIGAGGGGFSLLLGKTGAGTDFTEQLRQPRGRLSTGAGGLFLNAQVGWQLMLGSGEKQGWSVGVKAGYKYPLSDWKMDVNGEPGSNAPSISLKGYYVTISIGGGGIVQQDR